MGRLVAFLVGFMSQSRRGEAYIHFVGVDPASRGQGLGRALYRAFFKAAADRGAHVVRAVTSPMNTGSLAFHRAMGFRVGEADEEAGEASVLRDYAGPGQHRLVFSRSL